MRIQIFTALFILPAMVFAQIDCEKIKEISYEFHKGKYEKTLKFLDSIKSEKNKDLINYHIAELFYYQKEYKKANEIFEQIYNFESDLKVDFIDDCELLFDANNEYFQNIIYSQSSKDIKESSFYYIFLINEHNGKYKLALKQFYEIYSVDSKDKHRKFTCFNAFESEFRRYEFDRVRLLNKLDNFLEINKHSLSMLLLTNNQEHLNLIVSNLKMEYSKTEIQNELENGISKIKKGAVEIFEREYELDYIPFFNKKIVIWNYNKKGKELIENIKSKKGYKMLIEK